jgi:hypothetical protein
LNIFADAQRLYPSHESRRAAVRLIAERYKGRASVWFRVANEPYQNGWSSATDPQLLDLAELLASILGHRDFAIGDVPDGDDEQATSEQKDAVRLHGQRCNILVIHGSRKEEKGRVRTVEHMKTFGEMVREVAPNAAGLFDENIGFAPNREIGRRDNRPATGAAMAATAAIFGMGYTHHVIPEQDGEEPVGIDECRHAFTVETAPDFRYANANTSGSWVGTFTGSQKVRPSDNEARGYAAGIGQSTSTSIATVSGWKGEQAVQVASDGRWSDGSPDPSVFTLWKGTK